MLRLDLKRVGGTEGVIQFYDGDSVRNWCYYALKTKLQFVNDYVRLKNDLNKKNGNKLYCNCIGEKQSIMMMY